MDNGPGSRRMKTKLKTKYNKKQLHISWDAKRKTRKAPNTQHRTHGKRTQNTHTTDRMEKQESKMILYYYTYDAPANIIFYKLFSILLCISTLVNSTLLLLLFLFLFAVFSVLQCIRLVFLQRMNKIIFFSKRPTIDRHIFI